MKSTERDARSSSVPAMRPPGSPRTGVPGRLHREAAGERPPRARPQRRGSPGPIPNPAVKPAFAESTAARGCGRAGRRARGGRFSMLARFRARGDARGRAACAEKARRGDVPLRAFFASWAAGPRIRHLRRLRLSVWPSSRRRCGVRAEGPRRELLRGPFRVKGGKSIRWCRQRSAAVGPGVGISRSAGPFCAMKLRGVCRMLRLFDLRLF